MLSRGFTKAVLCRSRPNCLWSKRFTPVLTFSARKISQAISDSSEDSRQTGRVKLWSEDRGYGFIVPLDGGDDLFVHRSALNGQSSLEVGQQVSYSLSWNERKRKHWAANVDAQVPWEGEEEIPERSLPASSRDQESGLQSSQSQNSSEKHDTDANLVDDEERSGPSLLRQLEMQALEQQQAQQTVHHISSDFSSSSSSRLAQFELPSEPVQVEPFVVPEGISLEQRLQLMAEHMEQLRLQSLQNQQLLLQGIYAMLQQQAKQTTNLERAMLAIADRVGSPVVPTTRIGSAAMLDAQTDTSPKAAEPAVIQQKMEIPLAEASRSRAYEGGVSQVEVRDPGFADETVKECTRKVSNETYQQTGLGQDTQVEVMDSVLADKAVKDRTQNGSNEISQQTSLAQDTQVEVMDSMLADKTVKGRTRDESNEISQQTQDMQTLEKPKDEGSKNEMRSEVPTFHIVGTFNDWSGHDHILPCSLTVRWTAPKVGSGDMRREEFQILGDGDWNRRIFPAGGDREEAVPVRYGQASPAADGTGRKDAGHGRNWVVKGRPGTAYRVSYDPEAQEVRCDRT